MVATSGARLISEEAVETLKKELFPLACVLTPNIPETEVLTGMEVKTTEDMIEAAKRISEEYHCAVLCKGGHQLNDANDLLYADGTYRWFNGKRISNPNTHGTGCTLSSAIASNLAAPGCPAGALSGNSIPYRESWWNAPQTSGDSWRAQAD